MIHPSLLATQMSSGVGLTGTRSRRSPMHHACILVFLPCTVVQYRHQQHTMSIKQSSSVCTRCSLLLKTVQCSEKCKLFVNCHHQSAAWFSWILWKHWSFGSITEEYTSRLTIRYLETRINSKLRNLPVASSVVPLLSHRVPLLWPRIGVPRQLDID